MTENVQALKTPTGKPLPASLQKFHITNAFDPGPAYRRRIFLLGYPGCGKTTWIRSNPDALVLDFEDGARDSSQAANRFGPRTNAAGEMVIPKLAEYEELMKELVALGNAGRHPFKIICFDTIDGYVTMSARDLCAKKPCATVGDYGAKGAGWEKIRTPMFNHIDALWAAGYGWVIVGHLTDKIVSRVGKEDRLVTQPSVSDSFRKELFCRCQYLFYSIKQRIPVEKPVLDPKTGQPRKRSDGSTITTMSAEKRDEYRIQVRTPFASDEEASKARIPIGETLVVTPDGGYQTYEAAYNRAVAQQKEKTNG